MITPDGPKGPRHIVKGSICKIAKRYDAPIVYASYSSSRKKLLNSWDKFILPIPFFGTKITIEFSAPILQESSESANEKKKDENRAEITNEYLTQIMQEQVQRLDRSSS